MEVAKCTASVTNRILKTLFTTLFILYFFLSSIEVPNKDSLYPKSF